MFSLLSLDLKNTPWHRNCVRRNISPSTIFLWRMKLSGWFAWKKETSFCTYLPVTWTRCQAALILYWGTEAFALDGRVSFKKWDAKRITLPMTTSSDSRSETSVAVQLNEMKIAKVLVEKNLPGETSVSISTNWWMCMTLRRKSAIGFKMGRVLTGIVFIRRNMLRWKKPI